MNFGYAQTNPQDDRIPLSRLTIEPAIGTRLLSLIGDRDIRVANLLQFNYTKKLSFIAHTGFSSDFSRNWVPDVKQNYSFTLTQKFGLGTSFNTRRATNAFFILGGLSYQSYSGTLNNSRLPENTTTKINSIYPDYGVMYNLKSGRKKYYLSSRLYLPLTDGLYGIIENANVEFGIGFRLK
jgi:hypothetical protein